MESLVLAFATDDGTTLTRGHVGSADRYQLYRITAGDADLIGERINPKVEEDESLRHGDPVKAKSIKELLDGADGIVGRRFGPNITRMIRHYICIVVRVETIQEAILLVREAWERLDAARDGGVEKPIILTKEAS